jgi:hypothetical protein
MKIYNKMTSFKTQEKRETGKDRVSFVKSTLKKFPDKRLRKCP